MKYKPVIFDLYGTLVDIFESEAYEKSVMDMADAFGTRYEDYKGVWSEITVARNTGVYPTSRDVIKAIAEKLGITVDESQLQGAVNVRHEFHRKTMVPRNDAIDVLQRLRNAGIKTALISNCSPATEEYWDKTPFPPYFDVTVFSSSSGCRKPDRRIYRLALDPLGVEPEACLYVGDGDGNELTGALEAGMNPVMIKVPYENDPRFDTGRQEWGGPVIGSLSEILDLAGLV